MHIFQRLIVCLHRSDLVSVKRSGNQDELELSLSIYLHRRRRRPLQPNSIKIKTQIYARLSSEIAPNSPTIIGRARRLSRICVGPTISQISAMQSEPSSLTAEPIPMHRSTSMPVKPKPLEQKPCFAPPRRRQLTRRTIIRRARGSCDAESPRRQEISWRRAAS